MRTPNWKLTMAIAASATLLSAGSSRAEDSFPPCWRGSPGTTYQLWNFPTNNNPASADTFTNSDGVAQATMAPGPFGTGWKASSLGRSGVWDIGPSGTVSLAIPNAGGPATSWKYVNVQVTYFDDGSFYLPPAISIAGGTFVSSQVADHEVFGPGTWRTLQSVWLIQPAPVSETVVLTAGAAAGLRVDQVIVDTRRPVAGDGDVAAFRPCWRGLAGSTFQQWLFGVSNNPASIPAELVTNVYGAPRATISFGSLSDFYIPEDSFLGCRQGIWDLGHSGTMTLTISNTPSGSASPYKYVQVQVTQYRDSIYTNNAVVSISGATLVSQTQQTIQTNGPGRTWVVARSIFRLGPPCPASESVVITAGVNGALIDQVVVDTLALDFACPADITVNADAGQCSKSNVTWTLPAVDGCIVTNVTSSPTNGSSFLVGTNLVTNVIYDGQGGTKTCLLTVIVHDTQPPTVVCPANITVAKDPAQCGAFVSYTPTALDNCTATAGGVPASGSPFPLGLTTVSCTATDASGNVSSPCAFTVRVVDYTGDRAAFIPCWRGQPNTTFQQWAFSVSNNPAAIPAELTTNAFGTPSASISFGALSDHFIESDPFLGCRQGIWDLGHSGTMTLVIPNTPGASSGSYKYVRVQVTQYRDSIYTNNAAVTIAGATLVSQQQQTVQTNGPGRTWVVAQTILRVGPPCPASESILVAAGPNGALIDQVVVDTLCLDFACPSDIAGVTDAGQCSLSNVTWTLPAVNGCTVASVASTPTNGSTFAVGTNLVSSVITDGEGGMRICNFVVVVADNQPPVISGTTATEVQPYVGALDVKNCANVTVQGTVKITVQASDQCPLAPPIVGLTNGLSGTTATFVNQSPAGTFNYTWTVGPATANGTWTNTVNASDSASTVTSTFVLCVDNSQITGQVELESFFGSGTSPIHTRSVTFVATTNNPVAGTNLLKTWSLALSNVSGATFAYTLTGVPLNANGLSAKTDWNLRRKQTLALSGGQGTLNFISAAKLFGGDINAGHDNKVNGADDFVLKLNFGQSMPAAGPFDINGDGNINGADDFILKNHFGTEGDPP